jgi:CBS domain-containing protein
MFSMRVRDVMEKKKLLTAPPDTTVAAAARMMAKKNVGAVLVVEGTRLVGIFTERDAVHRVLAKGLEPKATRLAEVMTASPITAAPTETFGRALHVMHEHSFRHMPVVDNGALVGIVSARSAMDPEMEEFVSEAQRRLHVR